MKRKVISAMLSLAIVVSLAACSNGGAPSSPTPADPTPASPAPTATTPVEPAPTDSAPAETPSGGVEVDEGLLSVEIPLPASLFEGTDMTAFDPDNYAQEQGFASAVLNDDGSVTVKMSKAKHSELLAEMSKQYDESFAAMVEADDSPYIKSITHTDDFSAITAQVDRTAYEAEVINLTPFVLGMSGMMYQAFTAGTPRVEVIIEDADTGDIVTSFVFPDDMNG